MRRGEPRQSFQPTRKAATASKAGAAWTVIAATAGLFLAGGPAEAQAPSQAERGAYLARAGNCVGCHTEPGAPEFSGGRGVDTPFGVVYAPNLTPDPKTGLASWSAADFWNAMHEGRSKDGRLLYPAFPYPYYTIVTREDSDAILAYLRTLAPVERPNKPHALRFPYNTQASLAVWRRLSFQPARFEPDPKRPAEWNRGAYLVRGLGHCGACHSPRNILGASLSSAELGGAALPSGHWYAPSLTSAQQASVADWEIEHIVALLETGRTDRASTLGPMAEVVFRSTQYLSDEDLRAMAVFLKTLRQEMPLEPAEEAEETRKAEQARTDYRALGLGNRLYEDHCAQCHGEAGQGAAGAYSPLAGNRAVTLSSPVNVIRVVLDGGFAPATEGNPRPFGMPPFSHVLDNAEVAAVVSYIRNAWGNRAPAVSALEVLRQK